MKALARCSANGLVNNACRCPVLEGGFNPLWRSCCTRPSRQAHLMFIRPRGSIAQRGKPEFSLSSRPIQFHSRSNIINARDRLPRHSSTAPESRRQRKIKSALNSSGCSRRKQSASVPSISAQGTLYPDVIRIGWNGRGPPTPVNGCPVKIKSPPQRGRPCPRICSSAGEPLRPPVQR